MYVKSDLISQTISKWSANSKKDVYTVSIIRNSSKANNQTLLGLYTAYISLYGQASFVILPIDSAVYNI